MMPIIQKLMTFCAGFFRESSDESMKRLSLFLTTVCLGVAVVALGIAEASGTTTHGAFEVACGFLAGVGTGSYLGGKAIGGKKDEGAPT